MGCTDSSQTNSIQKAADTHSKLQRKVATPVGHGKSAVTLYIAPHIIKMMMYDSTLSGEAWFQELLVSN